MESIVVEHSDGMTSCNSFLEAMRSGSQRLRFVDDSDLAPEETKYRRCEIERVAASVRRWKWGSNTPCERDLLFIKIPSLRVAS